MKIGTMEPLVDTKDLFQALAEVRADITTKEARTFLLHKLREACRQMRETAKHVEGRLNEYDPPPPKAKRKRRRAV